MKKEVITSAKTIEEAVALAVAELEAPSADAITYTVLEEPKKVIIFVKKTIGNKEKVCYNVFNVINR